MIPILHSVSVWLQYSVTVYLVHEELLFSFHDTMLPCFFVVLDEFYLCWYLWSNKHFSSVGKNVLLDSSNSGLSITGLSFYFSVDGNVAQVSDFFTWAASRYFWGIGTVSTHCSGQSSRLPTREPHCIFPIGSCCTMHGFFILATLQNCSCIFLPFDFCLCTKGDFGSPDPNASHTFDKIHVLLLLPSHFSRVRLCATL